MNEALNKISNLKIVPVVVLEDAENAHPLAEALVAGGLPCAEVTFRTDAALESIKAMSKVPELLLGAGTVLTIDTVKAAMDAGASFIVSPGFNPKVVGYCVENNIPITPGISNPTDIEMALEFGLEVVKFFPAEAMGGVKTLKAISAPYNKLKFMPTGGISASNIMDYLSLPFVIACGGSWMVKGDLINNKNFTEIKNLTAEAVSFVNNN